MKVLLYLAIAVCIYHPTAVSFVTTPRGCDQRSIVVGMTDPDGPEEMHPDPLEVESSQMPSKEPKEEVLLGEEITRDDLDSILLSLENEDILVVQEEDIQEPTVMALEDEDENTVTIQENIADEDEEIVVMEEESEESTVLAAEEDETSLATEEEIEDVVVMAVKEDVVMEEPSNESPIAVEATAGEDNIIPEEETVVEKSVTLMKDTSTSVPVQPKKDISWMELLGAAAEVAGALGGAAIKVASENLIPKEVVDVSIPYDSACFQAYTEWLCKYQKEDPLLERYDYFSKTYKRVTIANVVTKKKLRERSKEVVEEDSLEELPKLISLDQYADLSEEEYTEVMKSLEPKTWTDLLGELATITGKAAASIANGSASVTPQKKEKTKETPPLAPKATNTFSFFVPQIEKKKPDSEATAGVVSKSSLDDKATIESATKNIFSFVSIQNLIPSTEAKVDANEKTKVPDSTKEESPVVPVLSSKAFSFLTTPMTTAKKSNTKPETKESTTKAEPQAKSMKPFSFLSAVSKEDKPAAKTSKKPLATDIKHQSSSSNTALSWFGAPTLKSKKESSPSKALPKSTVDILPSNRKKPGKHAMLSSSKKKPSKTKNTWKGPGTSFVKKRPAQKKTSSIRSAKNTISIVQAKDIPSLSRWKINKDGSITGFISNSDSYKTGTKITTSPIVPARKGSAIGATAKAGSVVVTDSGSKYMLKP